MQLYVALDLEPIYISVLYYLIGIGFFGKNCKILAGLL